MSKTTKNQSDWVSIGNAAEILDCSKDTIRNMIARGQLNAYRIGHMIRIKRTDIQRIAKPIPSAAVLQGGGAA